MRISDWSSDVCSSDLPRRRARQRFPLLIPVAGRSLTRIARADDKIGFPAFDLIDHGGQDAFVMLHVTIDHSQHRRSACQHALHHSRSEEHTSELQSLMRISYAVFCLKKKKTQTTNKINKIKHTINATKQY